MKIYYFASNSKTTWLAKLKFQHNVGAYECFMQTEFRVTGHVTKILQAINGQKVDEFEPIYLGNYDIDEKWFVNIEHTINYLYFNYVYLPQVEY